MKAILITGYHFNENVKLVDVREAEKSYMVDGVRFSKREINENGCISVKRSQGAWASSSYLYSIDSEYALSKLDYKRHAILCDNIHRRINTSITKDQAKAIAEILGL